MSAEGSFTTRTFCHGPKIRSRKGDDHENEAEGDGLFHGDAFSWLIAPSICGKISHVNGKSGILFRSLAIDPARQSKAISPTRRSIIGVGYLLHAQKLGATLPLIQSRRTKYLHPVYEILSYCMRIESHSKAIP
jgi:hypothetical protein